MSTKLQDVKDLMQRLIDAWAAVEDSVIMRPSSLGGGRILRRTLSVRLSVCPSVPLADVLCLHLHRLTSEHPK